MTAVNDFDKAARFAARRLYPPGFLRWLMGEPFWAAWEWRGWEDTQAVPFPGEPERRCDTVAKFIRGAGDAPPLALVIEFMSETRHAILERVGEFCLGIRRQVPFQHNPRVPYTVVGVVVNLTGESLPVEWSMAPPDCNGLGLWLKPGVCNLAGREATALLADIDVGKTDRCLLPWVPLMRGGDQAELLTEWVIFHTVMVQIICPPRRTLFTRASSWPSGLKRPWRE